MIRRYRYVLLGCAAAILAAAGCWAFSGPGVPAAWQMAGRPPRIRPDYASTVIPPNIAPLNFAIEEPGNAYRVRIHAGEDDPIEIAGRSPVVSIPIGPWKRLLRENRGGRLEIDVYVRGADGQWTRFDAIESTVAEEEIDSHLVYRLLGASYFHYGRLGIYQRNLENYDESPVLRNTRLGGGCVNCHAFQGGRPERFSLHVRPPATGKSFAPGMIGVEGGNAFRMATRSEAAPTPPSYTSWHPTAPLAAFSLNQMALFMHGAGAEVREVYDPKSGLAAIHSETGVAASAGRPEPDKVKSFPAWSGDGKHLYYCVAPAFWSDSPTPPYLDYEKVKYDLMRISYDAEKDAWGEPEPVLRAEQTGLSISEPRPSPDGRFLLCCMTRYGAFPVLQSDSDLYLLDLAARAAPRYRPLNKANSPDCESWHSWSSNSRWIVFSSKRGTGLLARPWICYIDREGNDHKPFVLPQRNPLFYDTFLKTYNVPELIDGPVAVGEDELARAARSDESAGRTESTTR